jgi:hypothetical protein
VSGESSLLSVGSSPLSLASPDPWPAGQECVARWQEDGVWYRARVEGGTKGLYSVSFIDYGNSDSVAGEDLVEGLADIPNDQLAATCQTGATAGRGRGGGGEEGRGGALPTLYI